MEGIAVALKSAEDVKAVAAELRRNTRTNLFYCAWVMQYESALRISDLLTLTGHNSVQENAYRGETAEI